MDMKRFRSSPSGTIPQVAEHLNVTYITAQGHVSRLEEAGILREVTGQERNQAYRADGVIKAIQEPLIRSGES